jgi:hypothetical protein
MSIVFGYTFPWMSLGIMLSERCWKLKGSRTKWPDQIKGRDYQKLRKALINRVS